MLLIERLGCILVIYRQICVLALVTCLATVPFASSYAKNPKALLARTMWSAFKCSTYASMADKTKEAERLFKLGYDLGKVFLEAVEAGKLSREEIREAVPVGVLLRLQGPTVDFMLGRIHAGAEEDAHDSIVKTDSNGGMLPLGKWIMNEEAQRTRASTNYLEGNCELLR